MQDAFSLQSHQRAVAAQEAGRFDDEMAPVTIKGRGEDTVVAADKAGRDTSMEALAKLKPVFDLPGGELRGRDRGHRDGRQRPRHHGRRGATMVASERAVERLGLKPLARLIEYAPGRGRAEVAVPRAGAGREPVLQKLDMAIGDFDLVEINEAFAA